MWSENRCLVMIRATQFCTHCNLLMLDRMPLYRVTQSYNRLVASSKMWRRKWRSARIRKLHDLQTLSTRSLNDSVSLRSYNSQTWNAARRVDTDATKINFVGGIISLQASIPSISMILLSPNFNFFTNLFHDSDPPMVFTEPSVRCRR